MLSLSTDDLYCKSTTGTIANDSFTLDCERTGRSSIYVFQPIMFWFLSSYKKDSTIASFWSAETPLHNVRTTAYSRVYHLPPGLVQMADFVEDGKKRGSEEGDCNTEQTSPLN